MQNDKISLVALRFEIDDSYYKNLNSNHIAYKLFNYNRNYLFLNFFIYNFY